jgi:hypothetical protein
VAYLSKRTRVKDKEDNIPRLLLKVDIPLAFALSSLLFILIKQCTGSPASSACPALVIFARYSKKA